MILEKFLKKCKKNRWALGQFNFSAIAQLKAVVGASKKLKAPVILGTSTGESEFLGLEMASSLIKAEVKRTGLPLFLNLDHGKSVGYVKKAVDEGYDMVHFDGSDLDLKENIKKTKKVVKYAHKKGVLVEGEVGAIGSESSKVYKEEFELIEENLTDPKQAQKFVEQTKVDCLAVNVGTFHGMGEKGDNPRIRLDLLEEIKERADGVPLVLHGGSGTPVEDIKGSIRRGIVKVNINTELRLAFTEGLRGVLRDNPQQIVPYKYLPQVIKKIQKVVEKKIKLFKSDNKI